MTRFALAVAGAERGASGLVDVGLATAGFDPSRFASAIDPSPSAPDWFRKCRRVVWRARWMDRGSIMVALPFGKRLVEVQEDVGDDGPRGEVANVGIFGSGAERLGGHCFCLARRGVELRAR